MRINSRVLLFRRRRGDEPAELNGELFTLERFPPNAEEEALQAWEAADEYLLQQVNDVDGLTLIFNDGFGALACALADRNPVSINDSFISELATRHNLRMNGIDEESVRFQDSLSPLPAAPALVLIKVPKQLALLEQQLRALREVVTPETRIIAAAKARDVHNSTLALFEKSSAPPPPRWRGKSAFDPLRFHRS
nr:Ribosomal RNA large subunit methyltransferase G [Klebsiella pneumoniae]